ncbi:Splicing factor U2AF 50 kDa subunit-like [Oopsacas minuta]|uniref:Splicing factor U2AF subunit n=1 Tax=Oopsacas minuta TaxID=111878 RepID=A0AAV7KBH4_9METZ|nr:Splicing factor U2AF 50 kDa subunit-like [Oopsacas minuta]
MFVFMANYTVDIVLCNVYLECRIANFETQKSDIRVIRDLYFYVYTVDRIVGYTVLILNILLLFIDIKRDVHRRERSRDRDRYRRRDRDRYRRSGSRDRSPRRRRSRSRERRRRRSRERSKGRERRRERSREPRERKRTRSTSHEKEKKVYKPRAIRSKPSKYWDIAPKGFEHISPLQFKAMQAAGQLPTLGITSGGAVPPPPPPAASQLTRQARRLYVGNIPFGITEDLMVQFINEKMHQTSLVLAAGNPVMSVQVNHDKNFAFIEFRSVEECSNALAFDGVNLQGQALRIRRPSDYKNLFGSDDEMAAEFLSGVPGVVSTIVADGPNKIFIGGLPNYLTDDQVKDLLISFGDLRAFNLVKDTASGLSKGYAFFEYKDSVQTELAIAGLNNMELGDKKLIVQRASVGARTIGLGLGGMGIPGIQLEVGIPSQPTCILCLLNMVTPEELQDIEEYEDIYEDVKNECSRSGKVISLEIPRPIEGVEVPGVGKIFVEFASIVDATKGSQALSGRKFAGRIVVTSFYDESRYSLKDFS